MYYNTLMQGGIRALISYDPELFNDAVLPDGVEKADVIDRIIYKFGDTPLFSPDPRIMKYYIASWSKRRLPLWNRYKVAIEAEYNPLENYDRNEEPNLTLERQISADNASDYQPDNKEVSSGTMRVHGNIGITTSQQMLASELDLIPRLDLIDYIADDFKAEFCLMMY